MYGDMSLEDVDDFEGLGPDRLDPHTGDIMEIAPDGLFEHAECRSFDRDFEEELNNEDRYLPDDYDETCRDQWRDDDDEYDDEDCDERDSEGWED